MADNKWNDNKIEELLGAMPDVQDKRSESDILARLKQDERLQQVPRRKKRKGWMPVFVAVAALLMIGILVPSMLRQQDGAMSKDESSDAMITSERANIPVQDHAGEENSLFRSEIEEKGASTFSKMRMDATSHVVLPDDLNGMYPFRIGLTQAANSIPVTFLLPGERVKNDFPDEEPDSVALYQRYAAEIPETDLGFDDYHPYVGEVTLEGDTVVHQVPEGHLYDRASATLEVYNHSIQDTFTDHAQFKTVDERGELANFDQVGKTTIVNLEAGKRPLPYYKYVMPSGQIYLIPYAAETTETTEQALLAMKDVQNDIVESVVPADVTYKVREENGVAVITFDSPLDLDSLAPDEATAMIEGFMLTASNYDQQVRLENSVQTHFGKYDLTSVLPEPIGVNPIPFPG
ncbi:hypothetical protein MHZ95_01295 [Sporosarcina sp. ACRSM]|uniref:hypothetical protein n=1 Tax=Sporosarcina sp. ACRSM TaxID=2918216 RepID=UPI001EF4C13E|nr:hypothetical protein [Sporosarcina sp. ACRSM]MCG7333906.1 hypothetical protein [Sporosarcina sp. ACRSM]